MLFRNISILDENMTVRNNMFVATCGEKIAYIGEEMPGKDILDAAGSEYCGEGKILLPGFVNAHSHSPMTLMRGYGENLSLGDWLNTRIFPFEAKLSEDDVYWGTLLAMAESIRFGIVSSSDMYYMCDSIAKAVLESGAKANISRSITCFTDDPLVKLPGFAENLAFVEKYGKEPSGRIKVETSIHAEYTTNPEIVRQMAEYTNEAGLATHVHISETRSEHEECIGRHGKTPVAYFSDLGYFDGKALAAHCVWITDEDIEILKEKKVSVATNPVSNLKLASGICNVQKLLDAGVNVALGTDSVASNNSLNMIEEMKVMALVGKGLTADPTVLQPTDVIRAATRNGALAQGREDCGLIKEGFRADLVVLDIDRPYMKPVHNLLNNIIYSSQGTDIAMTMVDGKVLYRDGDFLTLDIEKITAEVQRRTDKILAAL